MSAVYPEYVERMLAGSAVLRTKFPGGEELLGILTLSDDLEILNFETSESPIDHLSLRDVKHLEISDCLDLHVDSGEVVRLEFPDARIFADWSYGLQVLTVESEMSSDEISDLLREATDLNAKLLEDNVRLQRAVEVRDDLIKHLVRKFDNPSAVPLFRDWHQVSKAEIAAVCSGRVHLAGRDA